MVFYYAWPAARDNLGTNCTLGVEHLDILCSICSIQIFHELKRLFPLQTRSYDYSLATLFPLHCIHRNVSTIKCDPHPRTTVNY